MARTKYPVVDGNKTCSWCKKTKPIAEFYKIRQRGFEYYDSKCDECRRKYHAKYARKWYAEHPHISRDYSRKWKADNKERHDFLMWRSHVRRKYGLSDEQVHKFFDDPHCAICGRGNGRRRLCVDHCHKTGQVRGLLCIPCNTGIGCIDAVPDWCERVLRYLGKPPASGSAS